MMVRPGQEAARRQTDISIAHADLPGGTRSLRSRAWTWCCWTTNSPTPTGLEVLEAIREPAPSSRGHPDHGARQRVAGRHRAPPRRRRLPRQGPPSLGRTAPPGPGAGPPQPRASARRWSPRSATWSAPNGLAAIGEMTVTLHHEINNPLMAAFANVDMLMADPTMDAAARAGDPRRRPRVAAPDSRHHAPHRRSQGRQGPRTTPPGSRWWIWPTRARLRRFGGGRRWCWRPTRIWRGSSRCY